MKIASHEKPSIANIEKVLASGHLTAYEKQALKSYKQKIDEKTGYIQVKYEVEKFGRFKNFAVKTKYRTVYTATSMRREIRNALFKDKYDDLDIANSSGCVMLKIFKKHNLPTRFLEMLNGNREDFLQMIMKHLGVWRPTAKDIMIEIFFGGSGKNSIYWELNPLVKYTLPPVVEELKKEFHSNLEKLVEMKEYVELRDYCIEKKKEEKDEGAWVRTFSALLYQDEERKILDVLNTEICRIGKERKIQHPVGALIFDGLHVDKAMNIIEIVEQLESHIHSKTGYKLKLEIKPMELTPEQEEKYLSNTPLSYEARREWFERTHFKTTTGKKVFHRIRDCDPTDKDNEDNNDLQSYDKVNFSTNNEDLFEGAVDFFKEWFFDPEKRKYEDIDYSCVKEENKKKNMYYAFPTLRFNNLLSSSTPEQKAQNILDFKEYIKGLVEDNEDYVDWMEHWIADILQNPDTKGETPVSLILYSKQGTGKSSLTELMKRLLGKRCVYATETPTANGDIFHEFNSVAKYKLFFEIAEINMKTSAPIADQVKGFITSHIRRITHKGFDPIEVKATDRIVFTTNRFNSMFIEKSDRRMCAFHVSDKRLEDPEENSKYWKEFYAKIQGKQDDNNFIKDIADYLMSIDLTNYNLRDNRPKTKYYKSLIQFSIPVELDFLRDKLLYNNEFEECRTVKKDSEGKVVRDKDGHTIPTEIFKFGSQKLFESYCDWRKNVLRAKDDITSKSFKMKMEEVESYGISHKHDATSNVFIVNRDKLKTELYKDFGIEEEPSIKKVLTQMKQKEKKEEVEEKKEEIPEVVSEFVVPPAMSSNFIPHKKFVIPKLSPLALHDPNHPSNKK